jgi:diguanylate cyclase (GGDEF)-like protein
MSDFLAGLWNKAAILDFFYKEAERCMRTGSPLGLLLGALDVYETHGYEPNGSGVGDLVLEEVARRLVSCVRPYDWVGRYSEATFLILVPGCSPPDIWRLGDRLRATIGDEAIATPSGPLVVTISFGVAAWNATRNAPLDRDALLRACSAALTESKSGGRNRVTFAPWQDYRSSTEPRHSRHEIANGVRGPRSVYYHCCQTDGTN